MKKNKEWLKERIERVADSHSFRMIQDTSVLALIDQLEEPEQEKVTVPQFVADWIEDKKDWSALDVFYDIDEQDVESNNISNWLYDNDDKETAKREIVLLQAMRSGYTVEKEKRYYVYDKATKSYLGYNAVRTQLNWWTSRLENESFTEQEIKNIDERFWAFAEEVIK